ncbi:MAG: alpha/beta fold hydrolase [Gammaproteobacteria bacterium]|nr:alpha/beta fold hydrolase [Gammaproteobacteria bacterium]MBT8111927.1 alpha/beta fold hydrolase [Gammaproteobacteria bacterium]NND47946.1 alpha/beta fold hydrolase [Woeseiaceae bacterium]NNL46626.1 alpha/beta fold hydrolase [Woeseiaceae bacterium]
MSNILISAAALIVAVVIFRFAFPRQFLRLVLLGARRIMGLRTRSVEFDGTRWPYLLGGPESGEVLVLLHGFSGDKDNWLMYARGLRKNYRVIVPDLPGFGDNARDPNADYHMDAQMRWLLAFVDAMGIDRFHLGGNSMGGYIALKFVLAYADRIQSLALLDSAGVLGKTKSELQIATENGESLLTVSSPEEFDRLLKFIVYRPLPLPGFIKQPYCEDLIAHRLFLEAIFWPMAEEMQERPLNDQLHAIVAPTLVIWGRHDRLIDVSCVDVLKAQIPNNHCVVLEETGHVPMLERPMESAAVHVQFLSNCRAATL